MTSITDTFIMALTEDLNEYSSASALLRVTRRVVAVNPESTEAPSPADLGDIAEELFDCLDYEDGTYGNTVYHLVKGALGTMDWGRIRKMPSLLDPESQGDS